MDFDFWEFVGSWTFIGTMLLANVVLYFLLYLWLTKGRRNALRRKDSEADEPYQRVHYD